MKSHLYADGVENISLIEGMVRLDLFHYEAPAEAGAAAARVADTQLILPPAAFLRAFESMQRFVNELERKGVVSRAAAPAASAAPAQPPVSSSPNFS